MSKLKEYQAEFPNDCVIALSDGRIAIIKAGKGKHAIKAQSLLADSRDKKGDIDSNKYIPILMSMLVSIDKKAIVPEDLEEMSLADFGTLQSEFNKINFPLAQAT